MNHRATVRGKSTKLTKIDWARVAKRFPKYRKELERKKHDQAALARLVARLEKNR